MKIKWPIKFLAQIDSKRLSSKIVRAWSKMRIGVSLMGARDRLSAEKISICKESRRGPGNPRRVGGIAIKVV